MNTAVNSPLPHRLVSLDAYRGWTMLAMSSGGLALHQVAQKFPDSPAWQIVGYQFEHVPWVGCSLWDLIQPSFMFMVGVAMAYSCSMRQIRGQSYDGMLWHAINRALILIALGIFLRSDGIGRTQTNFTFEDVLTQIGLGYVFLFLLWGHPTVVQWIAVGVILVGYWCAFYFYPLPPPDFDYASVGLPPDWPHLEGIAAHWDKNTNAAAAFDQWFLNLFPRKKPFVFNGGGYQTLSFIPSLATMIFGLLAGEWLHGPQDSKRKFWGLVAAGVAGLAIGWLLDAVGICPIVKRIWTPSWAIFSTGWTCLILAGFYLLVDLWQLRRWTFPAIVVGMNSIAMYTMAELMPPWLSRTLRTHLGQPLFDASTSTSESADGMVPWVLHAAIAFVLTAVILSGLLPASFRQAARVTFLLGLAVAVVAWPLTALLGEQANAIVVLVAAGAIVGALVLRGATRLTTRMSGGDSSPGAIPQPSSAKTLLLMGLLAVVNWLAYAAISHLSAPEFRPLVHSSWVLLSMWLICYWMYRNKIFVRI